MAFPCKRLDPGTGEIIEVLRGRAFQPSRANCKTPRRQLGLRQFATRNDSA
jgi:hypothetical protein